MTDLSAVLDDFAWRGLIAESTDPDALRAAFAAGPVTYYCGFDPTAPSLHFGNLVQLVTMRRLQLAGHRPIGLVGGATGLVGDPSGKSAERAFNEAEVVAGWVGRIRSQVERYLSFEGDNAAIIANNLDWTAPMSAIEFLRDVGKHFSREPHAREGVSRARGSRTRGSATPSSATRSCRRSTTLSCTAVIGCTLQTGGSDQWGNLTAGVDLIRRAEAASVHALATPLLTRADGSKYGKTEGATLWLDPALTSPFTFYQYFLNVEDSEVGSLLRTFSFRTHDEIEALEAETAERPESRVAQRALAEELTTLVHGPDECERAIAASGALFGGGELAQLDATTVGSAVAELPHAVLHAGEPLPSILDLLVATGLAESRGDARRLIGEGGAYLNNRKVMDPSAAPAQSDLIHGRWLVLRRGKRRLAVAEAEAAPA